MSARQLAVLIVLLAGLGGLVWWVSKNTEWDETKVPTPLQGEAVTNPFYTAQKFSEAVGATSEWRKLLGTAPPTDAVLVLRYWHWGLIEQRRRILEQWVADGGRLVVDTSLSDGDNSFAKWSGLKFIEPKYDDDEEDEADKETEEPAEQPAKPPVPKEWLDMMGLHPDNCSTWTLTNAPKPTDLRKTFSVCDYSYAPGIKSERPVYWALAGKSKELQAVRAQVGRGSVTLINGELFGNRNFIFADHDLLFVALTQLKHGDHVIFLSEEEHPTLLALIWTQGKPVVLLSALFILLFLWRDIPRFGPLLPPPTLARRSLSEQIRGMGLFTLQFGGSKVLHAAMIKALNSAARRRIVNYESLSNDARIQALAKATQLDADKLAAVMNFGGIRTRHELQHAVALLEAARRQLLAPATASVR